MSFQFGKPNKIGVTNEARRHTLAQVRTAVQKKRLVFILTRDSVLEYLNEVTVEPITSTVRNIPSEVSPTIADGMLRDCAVNCDYLQTVPKGKIGPLITSLLPAKMADVRQAIRFALDL